jgi:hypothetical protein
MPRGRVLILWNQLDDDVVELWRRDNRRTPDWDPTKIVEPWETVAEEIDLIVECIKQGGYDVAAVNIRDSFDTLLDAVRTHRADVVMNLIEWFHDDLEHETHVPAIFELLDQSYTGNRPLALSMCQKKPQAKASSWPRTYRCPAASWSKRKAKHPPTSRSATRSSSSRRSPMPPAVSMPARSCVIVGSSTRACSSSSAITRCPR